MKNLCFAKEKKKDLFLGQQEVKSLITDLVYFHGTGVYNSTNTQLMPKWMYA